MDTMRRNLMGWMGGLALGGLGGCCHSPLLRRDRIDAAAEGVQLLLGSEGGIVQTSRVPPRSIDAHAHFFNGADIDAAGYLSHSVAHSSPELQPFIEKMAPVVSALTLLAPSAADEYARLMHANGLPAAAALRMLDEHMGKRRAEISSQLTQAMREQGAAAEYDRTLRSLARAAGAAVMPPDFNDATVDEILATLYQPGETAAREGPADLLGNTLAGVIRFVACMLQERWINLRLYRRAAEPAGIAGVCGAMVNFDYWYCVARSSPRDQMRLMALISRMSGGYMLPLIAYNPLTDVQEGGTSLQLVKDAITEYGYIGVKMYPPMGFQPYGNGGKMDEYLLQLFVWCAREKVPVMAHANRSMGRDAAADEASAPAGWRALAAAMPAGLTMRVNLGHLGGDGNERLPNQWTREFAALMGTPQGATLYGDLGMWSALRECRSASCPPLQRLQDGLQQYPQFGSRIMYGSDWFMMVKERDWQKYPAELARALALSGLAMAALFRANAIACFALDDPVRRGRLRAHLGKLPDWLD